MDISQVRSGTRSSLRLTIFALTWVSAVLWTDNVQSDDNRGQILFGRNCAICHQKNAKGSRGRVPPLVGEFHERLRKNREYMPLVLLNGLNGELRVGDQRYDGVMPSFSSRLDDEEIASILNFVRGLQSPDRMTEYSAVEIGNLRSLNSDREMILKMRE